jgi:hypothetical protein
MDEVGDVRDGADEEDVGRAVVPAVDVEERVAEQRTPERGQGCFDVNGNNECPSTSRVQPSAGVHQDQVDQKGIREAGSERAEADHDRRTTAPARPERRKPGRTCEQRQVTDPSVRPGKRCHEARHDECEPGTQSERGSRIGAPGISRQFAWSTRHDKCGQGVCDDQRTRREPGRVRRADPNPRHARLWHLCPQGPFVLATTQCRGSNDVPRSARP